MAKHPGWSPSSASFASPEEIPHLAHGDVELRLARIVPGDPGKGFVPMYHFLMIVPSATEVGHINLRVGETHHLLMTAGHIGFGVREEHRGHGYAFQACRALAPFIVRHYRSVIFTVDPDNQPSRRTIEKLGSSFIDEVDVPPHEPAYERGERRKRRYEWKPKG